MEVSACSNMPRTLSCKRRSRPCFNVRFKLNNASEAMPSFLTVPPVWRARTWHCVNYKLDKRPKQDWSHLIGWVPDIDANKKETTFIYKRISAFAIKQLLSNVNQSEQRSKNRHDKWLHVTAMRSVCISYCSLFSWRVARQNSATAVLLCRANDKAVGTVTDRS